MYVKVKVLIAQLCPTLRSYGLQPTSLLCPRDSPDKSTGVCSCFLFQGIFPTQGLNLPLSCLRHCRWILYHWATREEVHMRFEKIKEVIPLLEWAPMQMLLLLNWDGHSVRNRFGRCIGDAEWRRRSTKGLSFPTLILILILTVVLSTRGEKKLNS